MATLEEDLREALHKASAPVTFFMREFGMVKGSAMSYWQP
jgi:hypothetical protein